MEEGVKWCLKELDCFAEMGKSKEYCCITKKSPLEAGLQSVILPLLQYTEQQPAGFSGKIERAVTTVTTVTTVCLIFERQRQEWFVYVSAVQPC